MKNLVPKRFEAAMALLLLGGALGCASPRPADRRPQSSANAWFAAELNDQWESRFRDSALRAEFADELRAELETRVKTLRRSVQVYHYGTRGADRTNSLTLGSDELMDLKRETSETTAYGSPVELHPKEAIAYFKSLSSLFSKSPVKWQVGPGLYAAIDPVQSEAYAGRPWFMLEIEVPAGTRYLDLRPIDGFALSDAFTKKWFSEQFNPYSSSYPQHAGREMWTIYMSDILKVRALRTQIAEILKASKIDVFTYNWASQSIAPCVRESMKQGISFNFVNPDFLTRKGKINVFVQNLEANSSPEKRAEYRRVLEKIESAFVLVSPAPATAPATAPAIGGPAFSSETGRMRILAHGWAKVLGRKSLVEHLLAHPETVDQLYENAAAIPVKDSGVPYLDPASPIAACNEKKFKLIQEDYKEGGTLLYRRYYYDPMKALQISSPDRYAARLKEIQSTTFGCSPDHPEENQVPDVKTVGGDGR